MDHHTHHHNAYSDLDRTYRLRSIRQYPLSHAEGALALRTNLCIVVKRTSVGGAECVGGLTTHPETL